MMPKDRDSSCNIGFPTVQPLNASANPGELNQIYIGAAQWRTEGGGLVGFKPLPKFRSFDKAEPNAQLCGKYIHNCLVLLFHYPN
jgi:hypothetical protein